MIIKFFVLKDTNAKKYFRFSDNGRVFMITDKESSELPSYVTSSFNNAARFFLITLSALKQANKTAFDYDDLIKIFQGRKEVVFNKKEEKKLRPKENEYTKMNEYIIDFATDHLPIKDSNLTISKNILNSIRTEMYSKYVESHIDQKISYPILFLESYGNTPIISFKIYYIQSREIEKLKSFNGTEIFYVNCDYFAFKSNFDFFIDIYDFIDVELNLNGSQSINDKEFYNFINPLKI